MVLNTKYQACFNRKSNVVIKWLNLTSYLFATIGVSEAIEVIHSALEKWNVLHIIYVKINFSVYRFNKNHVVVIYKTLPISEH